MSHCKRQKLENCIIQNGKNKQEKSYHNWIDLFFYIILANIIHNTYIIYENKTAFYLGIVVQLCRKILFGSGF